MMLENTAKVYAELREFTDCFLGRPGPVERLGVSSRYLQQRQPAKGAGAKGSDLQGRGLSTLRGRRPAEMGGTAEE